MNKASNDLLWRPLIFPGNQSAACLAAAVVAIAVGGCGKSELPPPAPAPEATIHVPTSEGAAVVETSSKRTEPIGAGGRWKKYPDFLEGAQLHRVPMERAAASENLECKIRKDGVIVVAADRNQQAFDGHAARSPGAADDGKIGEVPGWEVIGKMSRSENSLRDEVTLFRREVKAGESIRFKTRYFTMPFLLELHGTQAARIRALTASETPILSLAHVVAFQPPRGLPADAARNIVMLGTSELDPGTAGPPILEREIVRQALLLAAREDFGMMTRDQTLREDFPRAKEAAWLPFDMLVASSGEGVKVVIFRQAGPEFHVLWQDELKVPLEGRLEILATRCEELSRREFAGVLQKAGLEAQPAMGAEHGARGTAAGPPADFNLIGQFATLRRLHADIRRSGESEEVLAALARTYAEIGAETAFLWSPAHKAFEARALLYAERLVQRATAGPFALWNRAYVRAFLGRHKPALDDLAAATAAAGSLQPAPAVPEWVDLIRAHCEFDHPALKAAETQEALRPLALYLQMLGQEFGTGTQARLATLERTLKACPDSFRAVDLVALRSPLGLARHTRERTLLAFPQSLARGLERVTGAPRTALDACGDLRTSARQGDVAAAMELQVKIAGLLENEMQSGVDRAEPSLGLLASLIRDAGFAHAHRYVEFVASWLAAPADSSIDAIWPLVEGHRYEKYIASLRSDQSAAATLRKELAASIDTGELELTETPMLAALGNSRRGTAAEQTFYSLAFTRADNIYRERAPLALMKDSNWQLNHNADLKEISPHSPICVESQILSSEFLKRFEDILTRAAEWERKYDESPEVLKSIAKLYLRHERDDDALRAAKRSFELDPEFDTGILVARLYDRRDDAESWKATLTGLLKQRSRGLEHARIQVELAERSMRLGQWDEALPFALAAAETWSGWGLMTASECYQGLRDWKNAELFIRRCSERYETSSFEWYFWCKATGHGDVAAAQRHAAAYVSTLPKPPPDYTTWPLVTYYLLTGDREAALQKCVEVNNQRNEPFSGLFGVITAQALDRPDEITQRIAATLRSRNFLEDAKYRTALYSLAELLRSTLENPASAPFDEEKFKVIITEAPFGAPTDLNFFAGACLQHLGQRELSQKYLMEAACSPAKRITRTIAAAMLVEQRVDLLPMRNRERDTDKRLWVK